MSEQRAGGKAGEVELDPTLQRKLLDQMRAEQEARMRTRGLRRWVLMPLCLLSLFWSASATFAEDQAESMVGGLVLSSLLWLGWKLRKRLPAAWGWD